MSRKILILAGDGIGPEITMQAAKVVEVVSSKFKLNISVDNALIGGAAIDAEGAALSEATIKQAANSDAILLGAVGGPKWDVLPPAERPEKAGLLKLRERLGLFANLRPAKIFPQLIHASSLKPELLVDLDLMIVRELIGDIYFGQPRGIRINQAGLREGFNTSVYDEAQIRRIAKIGFELALKRKKILCSVDKANVLETTMLWREVVIEEAKNYPQVQLSHMYVDNAAMQLVRAPKQFDVIVTGNMFGDILSDIAAMLTGSIGMLPSASLNGDGVGLYEPCHGSAPDIAGLDKANPIGTIMSVAMCLRHSLTTGDGAEIQAADAIEQAIFQVLESGYRTGDIYTQGSILVGTRQMGDVILKELL